MTDSKENLSKLESAQESKNENKVATLQKPRRGQSRAKPRDKDKKKLKFNF